MGSSVEDVVVSGDDVYLASYGGGLQVVDASDPSASFVAGACSLGGGHSHGVTVTGSYAYVADDMVGLAVFDVNPAQLTSLTPDHGLPGATVVIVGSDLGSGGKVEFGGTPAATSAWGDTSITCTVPLGVAAGATSVTVTPSGGATSNALPFSVEGVPAAGVLDPSFGGDGKVDTNLTSGADWASGAAVQADGKIVVAGGVDWGRQFVVARYNGDGTLDRSFSGDGRAVVDFTSGWDWANNLAIRADGKIVVVGVAKWGEKANAKFALARLNGDGTMDTTFSDDGKAMTDITTKVDMANGVLIQADGRIVVDGPSGVYGTSPKVALARYNSDGTLDTSFSGDGKVRIDFTPGTEDWANGSALQTDGKIVVAGCAGVGAPIRSSRWPASTATAPSTRPSATTAR